MHDTDHIDEQRLLYRRQFMLGPAYADRFPSWQRHALGDRLFLTAHPDLDVTQCRSGAASVTMLGYALDADVAEHGNEDIAASIALAIGSQGIDAAFERTARLGGRWAIIASDGTSWRLFTDATGHRQVFYTHDQARDRAWCATQPGLIAEQLGLQPDERAAQFVAEFGARNDEYWFPGDTSPYAQVRHLQPNHVLDLGSMTCRRFWPDRPLPRRSPEEAVAEAASLLEGIMRAAARRFKLALGVTAGLDSRLLLAASRSIRSDLFAFSMTYWGRDANHVDVRVPAQLLEQLGLAHHVIECPAHMDDGFAKLYVRNVACARTKYGPIAQGLMAGLPAGSVFVKGNANEITRRFYRRRWDFQQHDEMNGSALARITKMRDQPFAVEAFDRWLTDVDPRSNVDVLDLFYWENREGNWQAMSLAEWDVSHEALIPFNCRAYLAALLGVDARDREAPEYRLHRRLIESMWPETMAQPINPHKDASTGNGAAQRPEMARKMPSFSEQMAKVTRHLRSSDAGVPAGMKAAMARLAPLRAAWIVLWMRLSGIPVLGRLATRLAAWPAPPYTARFFMAGLHPRGYIDADAIVHHDDLQLGSNVFIADRVVLNRARGGGCLELGERVFVLRDTIIATGSGGTVSIGAGTTIQPACQIMGYVSSIRIGRNVQIAPHSALYSYDHGIDAGRDIAEQPLSSKGGIVVEDDAWIGYGSIVLDGVRIGRGAVVGAGAVVTQDVPDGAVAVGVPARVVRMRDGSPVAAVKKQVS